jgi:hypothetical protein
MGQVGIETVCDVGGFQFNQEYAKVTTMFFGRCATSPAHRDNDVTPVILYVCNRQGSDDGGGLFYNLDYGIAILLEEGMSVVFYPYHIHGSTVLKDEVILNGLSMSVTKATLDGLRRYNEFILPDKNKLQRALTQTM